MADNEVIIELKAKIDSIDKSLKNIEDKAEKTGDKVDKEVGSGLGKKIGTGFKVGAAAAAAALATVAVAAVRLRDAAVEASSRQQDAVNQLNQALSSSGTFTRDASNALQEYASQVQRTTTLGDELVIEQLALARTFARSNEEAQRLVDAAIELSAATGTELRSAVVNLGKSFSGLTGELGESVAEIRTLTAEQLKSGAAIDLIKNKYDGFAAAQRNTYSGATKVLSNSYGDLLETIGDLVTKNPVFVKSLENTAKQIERFSKIVADFGVDGLNDLLLKGLDVARFITSILGPVFDVAATFAGRLFKIIGNGVTLIKQLASGEIGAALETFKTNILDSLTLPVDVVAAAFKQPGTQAALGFIDGFKTTIQQNLGKEVADGFNDMEKAAKDSVEAITVVTKGQLVNGIKQSVAAFGGALAQGENAFAAFGRSALGVLGDFAIELGGFFVATGIGIDALKSSLLSFSGGLAIAAGIALIAIGGALKSFAGGPAGIGSAGGGADGGGSTEERAREKFESTQAESFGISFPEFLAAFREEEQESRRSTLEGMGLIAESTVQGINDGFSSLQEPESREPSTNVTVQVQGNILDRRETGLEIAKVINESFSSNGIVIARGVTG